jgi:hypothetical protein
VRAAGGATEYELEWRDGSGEWSAPGCSLVTAECAAVTALTGPGGGLAEGPAAYLVFRVRARLASGTTTEFSPPSAPVEVA